MYIWDEEKNEAREAAPEEAQVLVPALAELFERNSHIDVRANLDGTFIRTYTWSQVVNE